MGRQRPAGVFGALASAAVAVGEFDFVGRFDVDLYVLLERVPATVWGFLIGSLITVVGVVLTNAATSSGCAFSTSTTA